MGACRKLYMEGKGAKPKGAPIFSFKRAPPFSKKNIGLLREVILRVMRGGNFEGSFLRIMHSGPFEGSF